MLGCSGIHTRRAGLLAWKWISDFIRSLERCLSLPAARRLRPQRLDLARAGKAWTVPLATGTPPLLLSRSLAFHSIMYMVPARDHARRQ